MRRLCVDHVSTMWWSYGGHAVVMGQPYGDYLREQMIGGIMTGVAVDTAMDVALSGAVDTCALAKPDVAADSSTAGDFIMATNAVVDVAPNVASDEVFRKASSYSLNDGGTNINKGRDASKRKNERGALLQELAAVYRRDRRERGPRVADRLWVDAALDDWLAVLCGKAEGLRRSSANAFAVGMAEALAIRDALIVSLVTGVNGLDKAVLMDFVCRPHARQVCGQMGRMLSGAFRNPSGSLDPLRCRRGLAALEDIATGVPDRFRIQPLTAIAYVLWWAGDKKAEEYAQEALSIDERCSLASIVLSALRHGLYPTWLGQRAVGGFLPKSNTNTDAKT